MKEDMKMNLMKLDYWEKDRLVQYIKQRTNTMTSCMLLRKSKFQVNF
jgi:hypothetical protein